MRTLAILSSFVTLATLTPAGAASVKESVEIAAAPDAVWQAIGDFCGIAKWHPDIRSCRLSERGGGKLRTLRTAKGQRLVEQLEAWNATGRFYIYRLDLSPLPVKDCVAMLRVSAAGSATRVEWSATFEPSGVPEEKATDLISGLYKAGLRGLKAKF